MERATRTFKGSNGQALKEFPGLQCRMDATKLGLSIKDNIDQLLYPFS